MRAAITTVRRPAGALTGTRVRASVSANCVKRLIGEGKVWKSSWIIPAIYVLLPMIPSYSAAERRPALNGDTARLVEKAYVCPSLQPINRFLELVDMRDFKAADAYLVAARLQFSCRFLKPGERVIVEELFLSKGISRVHIPGDFEQLYAPTVRFWKDE